MRWRRLLLRGAAAIAVTLLALFGVLQTGVGQRLLFDAIASLAASPGRTLRLEGPSGFFPTDLKLAKVEVSDDKGIWLAAGDVAVSWSFLPLLGGRLDIQSIRAARIDVQRLPQAPPKQAPSTASSDSGSSLPVRLSVGSLVVDELRLGAALTGVDSRWKVSGVARVDGLDAANTLSFDMTRTDGQTGRLTLKANHDGGRGVMNAEGAFEEGAAGVIAALLGRPDLPRTSGTFKAEGSRTGGEAQLSVEAGDALRITGSGRMRPEATSHHVTVTIDIQGGRIPNPLWQAALAQPARLEADAVLEATGVIDVKALRVTAAPLEATATGRYDPRDKRLQLRVAATGGDPAMLAAIVPGAGWREARIEMQANGTLKALDATLSLRAAEIGAAPAAAKDVDLTASTQGANLSVGPSLRAQVKGTVGTVTWRTGTEAMSARDVRLETVAERSAAGTLAITSFDVTSSLLTVAASGSLGADGAVAATATLDLPDLSALKTVVSWPVGGAATLKADVTSARGRTAVALDTIVRDATVASVPPALLTPNVRAKANGTLDRQGQWRLEKASIVSDTIAVDASGTGRDATGTLDVAVTLPKLAALDSRYEGHLHSDIRIEATDTTRTVRLKARLAEAKVDSTTVERLDVDAGVTLRQDGLDGTLELEGASGDRPLRAKGRLTATSGERLSIPSFEATVGKANLSIRDLAVDRRSATGSAHLVIEDLKELGAFADQSAAGRLELTVVPDPAAGDGRLKLKLRGTGLALGALGAGTLNGEATIADPLGRASFDASLAANTLRGVADIHTLSLKASGDRSSVTASADVSGTRQRASGAVKARFGGDEVILDIDTFKGTRDGRPFVLAQATQLRHAGTRTVIEPLRLNFGGGQVRVAGVLDATSSDLAVDVTTLPLAEIAALAGADVQLTGVMQAQLRVRGPRDSPQIDATYTVRDARLRSIATASMPAITLTGAGTVRDRNIAAEARVAAGGNNLILTVAAQLPPEGSPTGTVKLAGPIDLAMFASLLGPDIQQVGGRAVLDVTLGSRGGRPVGSGTVRLDGVRLALPSEGLTLSQGTGLIRLTENRIVIERLAFPSVGKGDISVSGEARLNDKMTWPLDLRVETRNARLLNRRDLVAELTSSLRLTGSVAEGLTVQGPIRIDRAEIGVTLGGAAKAVPTVPVREVGAGAPKRVKTPAPSKPLALDLKVNATQAIFVRGKGLDAEVQGDLAVSGSSAAPSVTGGLRMRRGTYTVLGRPLRFTRGNVTFVNADRIMPTLDMAATTRSGSITVEVTITGPASEPKIVLTSTPPLPPDEVMSHFLFQKGASELGPSQLVQVAEALAELTGTGSSASAIDTVRRKLGLDRLGIGQGDQSGTSDSAGNQGGGLAGAGVEGGKYIARGVYLGGRQTFNGESVGVVQIEVIPHVKIEGEVGTRATGRAGVAIEYDY